MAAGWTCPSPSRGKGAVGSLPPACSLPAEAFGFYAGKSPETVKRATKSSRGRCRGGTGARKQAWLLPFGQAGGGRGCPPAAWAVRGSAVSCLSSACNTSRCVRLGLPCRPRAWDRAGGGCSPQFRTL